MYGTVLKLLLLYRTTVTVRPLFQKQLASLDIFSVQNTIVEFAQMMDLVTGHGCCSRSATDIFIVPKVI